MKQGSFDRRAAWAPPPRPDWVKRVNDECSALDIRSVVPLVEQSLLDHARRNTGLSDFEDDGWLDHFRVLLEAIDKEAKLHFIGRVLARSDFLGYPDATCFWTHRSPEDYFASFFAMMEILYRPVNRDLYKEVDARAVIAQLRVAYDALMQSDWIDDPRMCHIRFNDLIRDPAQTIGDSFAARGISFTPAYEAALRGWTANPAHRSDRHGKFEYSLAQFGLSAAEIRTAFAGYYERFGLR
jgi:Sulfotransferase family